MNRVVGLGRMGQLTNCSTQIIAKMGNILTSDRHASDSLISMFFCNDLNVPNSKQSVAKMKFRAPGLAVRNNATQTL